jgi:hypothetical protein
MGGRGADLSVQIGAGGVEQAIALPLAPRVRHDQGLGDEAGDDVGDLMDNPLDAVGLHTPSRQLDGQGDAI